MNKVKDFNHRLKTMEQLIIGRSILHFGDNLVLRINKDKANNRYRALIEIWPRELNTFQKKI